MVTPKAPRRLKPAKYRRFHYTRRIKHPSPKLPNSYDIFKQSLKNLWRFKWFFIGLTTIYGILTVILVKGLSSNLQLPAIKNTLETLRGSHAPLGDSFALFKYLLTNIGTTNNAGGVAFQTLLLITFSLAIIWGLRQAQNLEAKAKITRANRPRVKDSLYKGMYPLVPFILILLIISVELIPLVVGNSVYSSVINNGFTLSVMERVTWTLAFFILAVTSLYLLTTSLFALYIVTLPDMVPLKAMQTAGKLVRFRRWTVMRKIIFLPILLLLFIGLVMLPILIWVTVIAQWTFFVLTLFSLSLIHAYMYSLYRSLL